jgi:hypothetical protein
VLSVDHTSLKILRNICHLKDSLKHDKVKKTKITCLHKLSYVSCINNNVHIYVCVFLYFLNLSNILMHFCKAYNSTNIMIANSSV